MCLVITFKHSLREEGRGKFSYKLQNVTVYVNKLKIEPSSPNMGTKAVTILLNTVFSPHNRAPDQPEVRSSALTARERREPGD